jgi:hypothetical protein
MENVSLQVRAVDLLQLPYRADVQAIKLHVRQAKGVDAAIMVCDVRFQTTPITALCLLGHLA